ncbi:Ena/VASP-like protein [Plecturocebus cupreus]
MSLLQPGGGAEIESTPGGFVGAFLLLTTLFLCPSSQRQVQNGPSPDEMDIQRRQVVEQHQQQRQESLERRTSAAGPILPPGHPSSAASAPISCSGPPPPPPPPVPPPPTGATPPPPPPLPAGGAQGASHDENSMSGLAAAIAGAKLRRVQRPEDASGGSSPSGTSKSDANRASSGGGGGGLMEEMNKLLAKRRKAASQSDKPAEKKEDESQMEDPSTSPSPGTRAASQPPNSSEAGRKPWERSNSVEKPVSSILSRTPSVAKSPEAKSPLQLQPHSRMKPAGSVNDVALDAFDLDRMKQRLRAASRLGPSLTSMAGQALGAHMWLPKSQSGSSNGGKGVTKLIPCPQPLPSPELRCPSFLGTSLRPALGIFFPRAVL